MQGKNCILHFVATGAVVSVVWLVTLLILWMLRKKRAVRGIKDTTNGCELTPVTDAVCNSNEKEDTLVYHQIAFPNGNRNPRKKNAEEEVTYAQVKTTPQQDESVTYANVKCNIRREKSDDALISSDPQTTCLAIKPTSQQPKPECSTDLYAAVIKKNIVKAE